VKQELFNKIKNDVKFEVEEGEESSIDLDENLKNDNIFFNKGITFEKLIVSYLFTI